MLNAMLGKSKLIPSPSKYTRVKSDTTIPPNQSKIITHILYHKQIEISTINYNKM